MEAGRGSDSTLEATISHSETVPVFADMKIIH